MGLLSLRQGGSPVSGPWPWGSPASLAALEARPGKASEASDLLLPLASYVRKRNMPRTTVLAHGRARTRTRVSCPLTSGSPPMTSCCFLWFHILRSNHLEFVFIFSSGSTYERKGPLNFFEGFDSFSSELFN